MKRRIVQHGPSTLTVSLPAPWAKRHSLRKGAEIDVEETEHSLTIRAQGIKDEQTKTFDLRGLADIYPKIIGAIYKLGYDDVILEYETAQELAEIQRIMHNGFIGLEVVEERQGIVRVRTVSEPDETEFRALLRRMFHFLLAIADESLNAAHHNDKSAHELLVPRDESVNRIADFLRRVTLRHGQREWASDCALYYVVEQVEKCADAYKHLNRHLATHDPLDPELLELYAQGVELTHLYAKLFWDYSPKLAKQWFDKRQVFRARADELSDHRGVHRVFRIVQSLYDLFGTTIMLGMAQQEQEE